MNEFKYSPEDGLLNTVAFPTDPEDEAAARTQFMTPLNQIKDYFNNEVKPAVDANKAATDANSEAIATLQGPDILFCKMRGIRFYA